jgi:hypothetical protein
VHRVLRRIGPVLFLFGAVECGTDPDEFGRCTGGLQVGVAYAPALQLHWTPADCSMFTLSIDNQAQVLMWDLSTIETRNGIDGHLRCGAT